MEPGTNERRVIGREVPGMGFEISQLGSSVATSLIDGESKLKHKASTEQKHVIEDLNERLSASIQSCVEANSIIRSQKVNIAKLKEQLDEERTQQKEE
ncbi:hypothetical protein JHK86_010013 [Glycine max]|nr:hypothetical protein JHK86_010013 [Glycine max]